MNLLETIEQYDIEQRARIGKLEAEVNKLRATGVASGTVPLNLGELIDALARCEATVHVRIASPTAIVPTLVESYRGYYEDLAINYVTVAEHAGEMLLSVFLRTLRNSVGESFTGYKGGEYAMDRDSVVRVSNYGRAEGMRVSGVVVDEDIAYLTLLPRHYK